MSRRQVHISLLLAAVVIGSAVAISWADEQRERVEAMRREAAELAEQGRVAEAERLTRKADEMLESLERREHETDLERAIAERQRRLEDLLAAHRGQGTVDQKIELERQIDRIRHELEELNVQRKRHRADERHHRAEAPPAAERIKHMLIAAEHLDAAGMHDMAREVRQRAQQRERELHQRRHGGPATNELAAQLEEVRRELGRLREEMNQLREQVERR